MAPEGMHNRGLVHFSAERLEIAAWTLPENMYLTPSPLQNTRHSPRGNALFGIETNENGRQP